MINKIKYSLLVLVAIIAASCESDQNFKYDKTNELTVAVDTTGYQVIQFDILNIEPKITASLSNDRSYSYEWSVYTTLAGKTPKVISTEKNLNVAIDLPVNSYYLQYNITDKKTGIVYPQRYTLKVYSGFYEGWLVTSNNNGKGQLSFIRKDGTVMYNPAENINNKTYPGKGYDSAAPLNDLIGCQQIYYFSGENIYIFDANSFSEISNSEKLFGSHLNSTGPTNVSIGALGYNVYVVNNGKIHSSAIITSYEGIFTPTLLGDYDSVFPYSFVNNSFNTIFGNTYFYDNVKKRFVYAGYADVKISVAAETSANAYFDIANVNKTMIAAAKGTGGLYHAVMKDDATNKCYLYSLDNGIPSQNQEINIENIHLLKGFDALSSGASLAYFGIENKLYKYDIAANSVTEIYAFPSRMNIADIKAYKNPYLSFSLNPDDPEHNKKIAVAVNNGTTGEVFIFNLTGTGNLIDNTFSEHYTGFGEIASLSYRNRT